MWKALVAGAVGGGIASFAMNQFQAATSRLFENPAQHPRKKERARQAQGWREHRELGGAEQENATTKAATAIAHAAGYELSEDEKASAGNAIHYAYGIGTGAAYAAAAERWPVVRAGYGAPFGALVWLVADEIAVPALKLSKSPRDYPPRVHAMALGAHVVYGLTVEIVRRALRGR